MRSKATQISIAMVCLVLGFMLSIQFKTAKSYQPYLAPERVEELTQKINSISEERAALAEEVVSLREKLQNVRETDQAMKDLQDEMQKAKMVAGLIAVEGPGIIITLDDNPRSLQAGENPNRSLIHESDLLIVVNELKASGAEAIAINGERITAMSEIRCAGPLILVNWNRIAPPFIIEAIGDPALLESGMLIKGGYMETLKYLGYQTLIQKVDHLEVPSFSGRMKYSFSKPVYREEIRR